MSLCFFVDGLEEFSGDAEQLCMLFKPLEKRSGMAKFCLSSRPWVAFQENLGHCPKVRLQDLTFKDIEIYVRDKLQGSQAFMKLADRDPQFLETLKVEIMEKAQGVFLWVKVVIEQLLRGANNRDCGVEHGDVRPPNVLWNQEIRNVVLVDFERSEIVKYMLILQETSPNRKRKHLHPTDRESCGGGAPYQLFIDTMAIKPQSLVNALMAAAFDSCANTLTYPQ